MKSIRETGGEVTNFFVSYPVFLERTVDFCFFPTRFFVCAGRCIIMRWGLENRRGILE